MNSEQICMLCNKKARFEFVNRLRDDNTRNAYRCLSCGHVQVLPLPTQEEDNEFYQRDIMYKSTYTGNNELQKEENLMYRYRNFVYEQSEQLEKHLDRSKRQKILDIGTGYGWLVEVLRGKGFDIDGVELSAEKRELCKKRSGIDIFDWNFLIDSPDVREKKCYYDVICMMQTLEHISNPKAFLLRASELLKPGGMIFIDVPNFDDYLKAELSEYNNFAYTRMHLSYFTPDTLKFCLENSGFDAVETYGHQLYSFENALWWLRESRPFLDYHQIDVPKQLHFLNIIYKQKLEAEKKSNLLIGIGYKK